MMECENVYCNWVGCVVKITKLPESCSENFVEGRCMKCELSPQIELGMKPEDLLRNIKG